MIPCTPWSQDVSTLLWGTCYVLGPGGAEASEMYHGGAHGLGEIDEKVDDMLEDCQQCG